MDGMAFARDASLSMEPWMTLRKSMPSAAYRSAAVSASSKARPGRPPGCASSSDIRMPTTKSGPTASRTARITRRGNAMRFSRPPPHSSSRWLVAGDRKLSNRWPYASSSMPSRPPSLQRTAAAA